MCKQIIRNTIWKFINQIRDSPSTNLSPSIESLFNHFKKESNKETHNENLNIQVDKELNLENETNTLNKKITADEIMKCIKNLNLQVLIR